LKNGKPITKLISENQQEIKNTTASCELSSCNQKTHSVVTSWARGTICHCELSEDSVFRLLPPEDLIGGCNDGGDLMIFEHLIRQ